MEKPNIKTLRKFVRPFENADDRRSTVQIINTIIPLLIVVVLSMVSYNFHWTISLVLSTIASGFLVRTFIIFHDCCHGSFFKKKKYNEVLGNITGFLTFFSYRKWRREHLIHHAGSGNIDKRGIGDIWVMTVDEYQVATKGERLKYRMYRNPIVMFILGPIFLVLVSNRCNAKDSRKKERHNTWLNNITLVLVYGSLFYFMGVSMFFVVFGPIVFFAAMAGIWLFYIQHTFEDSYFEESSEWDFVKAAIEGSSYFKLPLLLQWITGNIGYHHVHHLSPKIPNYQLANTHNNVALLHNVTTISFKKSFESLKYKLYDEQRKCFITFKTFKLRYGY